MEYYYIKNLNIVGKIDNYVPFIYRKDEGWTVDNDNILMDRIMGYDGESIGNSSQLFEIKEITQKQAEELINSL